MKKTLLIALLFITNHYFLLAQPFTITGTIRNAQSEGISFASVSLHLASDSSLVKAELSDERGKFELIGIKNGTYILKASSVGYAAYSSKPVTVADDNLMLDAFILATHTRQLEEIKVTAAKPLIEVQNDKLVFNVESSVNAVGSNGLELLQKTPGVQVDKDENILIKGKTGVRIYIDGRPSQMNGKDLASVLRSMNSADIEAIEVITNPSAKYDAAGDLGIINIRLKKNRKMGTNGNVAAGVNFGITPKYNASINLNRRNKKLNIFGNYSYNQGTWHNTTWDNQILNNIRYNKLWNGTYSDTSHNFKVGADYFISSKHTFGVNVNGRAAHGVSGGRSETLIGQRFAMVPDSAVLYSRTSTPGKSSNLNANINYRYADTTGHELNVDFDYGLYTSRRINYQPNRYEFSHGENVALQRDYVSKTPVDITIKSIKVDYEQPLMKGKLGYGIKAADVKSDNTFDFFNVLNDNEIRDADRSNRFKYTERVYAGYVSYNRSLGKKWNIQAGLRAEHTKSLGELIAYKLTELDKVDTTYLNFFPSGAVSYKASKNHNWNLNYSRRINRPGYQNLNPFEYRIDELVYSKGNPFLKPEYANSFKLTHVYKSKLTTALGYWRTRFPVVGLRIPYDSSRTYFIPKNLDHAYGFTLDMSLTTSLTKWWEIYLSGSGYYNVWKAALDNGLVVNNNTTAFLFNGQSTFKIKNNWSVQLSGWYNSPYRRIDYNWAMGMMDIGVQKKFWKDNATIKVTYSDLLSTAKGGYHSEYAGLATHLRFKFEGQMLKVALTYRFGSSEIKAARSRKNATEEELNRIR